MTFMIYLNAGMA